MPKTPISWKFDADLLASLKKIAVADNRPLNNLVEKILTDFVDKNKSKKK
ncbi:MAG: hypothetical protein QM734_16350 [Cyclobacteriaceae bacterium]